MASLYNRLLDQLLLPPLVKRMEYVLADAIARQDSKAAYDALRIYLLLNLDKDHEDKYNAAEIQSWVINDLGNSDSVAGFGGRAAVLTHIEALFDGSRVVHSPYEKDEALIRQARAFLDGHTSTERIYARALAAMESEAPQEFTLVRAVGADAGTVFVRSNGAPLDRGVPGIFTREGYRELFDKRLPEFVAAATANDGWVMGRESTPKKLTDSLRSQIPGQEQSVAREVRRLYLTEYARRWQDFLDSIHSINSAGEEGSSGLAYDLQVLRTLASPDSPLMRLGKAVVEQTTLVPPPDPQARQKQLAQRASGNAGKVVQTAKLFQDIHPEERLEKTLVDDRFAALREVIAGRTDGGQSGGGTMQIASLLTMLNEYYTQLTIADSALAAGTLPARITAADKLQLEAAKLPAPLKNILLDLTKQGTRKINAGTGDVLNTQMEAMMGDDCRDTIDGRYPFADSPQEVSAEDFNRIFASGGVLDAFWSKQLAPLADTASDPWRYKPTEGNMTLQGPDLTPFQQAKQIRSVFFNSEGGKKFSWSMQISVVDMDPAITELVIDIDGQVLRYAHGPDRPLKVTWPGPRNGSMAEITASPRIRQDTSTLLTGGPWALFHLLDAGKVVGHEGRSVTYELRMEPWVKLLTHTSDYKAFQNKTVVDILDEVLAEYPYPVEKRLVESYPVRTWQVQYGETDFDFLQRLMQEWGIYWWFEHSEDSHTLVLADAISAHKACPDSPLVEWHQEGLKLDKEFIHTITANESLRTGQWVLDDFDFTKPRSLLANTVANPRETGHATYEHYEWPGDYFDKSEGEMLTRIRMEAQRSPGSRVLGGGNIRTLMTGYTFTLMNHPTAELNQEYLLAQTTLFVQDNAQHSGQDQHFTFSTSFELHPTREVYRPQRTISNLVCGVSEAKDSSECGYVATDKEDVAVIFDENNGQLSLFLNRDWLPDEERRDKRWLTPTPEGVSAFIHRQTLYLSDDLHSRNMTLNGSGALGLGDGRYLGGNWAAIWNQSEHYNNSQTWFDNLFVRQDLGNQYYLQAGRMDQRNLSSATGGDFGFSLLPLSRFDGLRTGTSASSLTAGYSSSLALSRNGLFWGGGQDGEPASGMAVNVESEGDEGSSGKVVSVRGSSQPFSLGFGQQSLLLMEGYNATEVTIEDAGVSSQGMAGVKAGGGSRRYFLTPGHLLVHNISASMSRLYVGRVLDKDGRPLLDAQPLNHPFLSLGPSGRFSLQSEHKESSLWLLSKNRILRCPMSVHKRRDVMQVVGDVRCELSDVDALPQALQISPRVIRLLNVAGLLRHAVQEA